MHPALQQNLYLVREHVGLFKAANNYDILDPATGSILLVCREEELGFFTRLLRFSKYKRMTPFDVRVKTPDGQQLVRATRAVSLLVSRVSVLDEGDLEIGGFQQKLFTIGGAFEVLGRDGRPVCRLQGKWTGWEFSFLDPGGRELARVTKKWVGLGQELFTSADNYVLEIRERVQKDHPVRPLIFAAVMCIDLVLKE